MQRRTRINYMCCFSIPLIEGFKKYRLGFSPNTFLKTVEKALGLLYPSSIATRVMDSPFPNRTTAASRQACCRHSMKLIPVCRRNCRVNVRRLMPERSAISSIPISKEGAFKNSLHARARRGSSGMGALSDSGGILAISWSSSPIR